MSSTVPENLKQFDQLSEQLAELVARLERIERYLGLPPVESSPEPLQQAEPVTTDSAQPAVEQRFGEYGLAWIGSVILLLGLTFLTAYVFGTGNTTLPVLVGFVSAGILYGLHRLWQRSFQHLSSILLVASFILAYYTTLRLHFVTEQPILSNRFLAVALMILVSAGAGITAVRRGSQFLGVVSAVLLLFSTLIADWPVPGLVVMVVVAATAAVLTLRLGWWPFWYAAMVLIYVHYLLWIMNNPIAGHPLQATQQYARYEVFLFGAALLLALPGMFKNVVQQSEFIHGAGAVLNGLGFHVLLLLTALTFFESHFAWLYLAATGLFLLISMMQWQRTHLKVVPSINACIGFLALTVAIFGFARIPQAYFWLSLQSLLVVCMALWYRSPIIVLANTFIYVLLFIAYFFGSPPVDRVNLSFALVALASARILNWKKERLTLKTDMFRNLYLITAFVAVPYFLYHAVPKEFVTISWTGAAALYFGLSLLLRNIKYRWMAIFTMLLTVIYLFAVDLPRLDPAYRIAAFVCLGLMSLAFSLYYARTRLRR